MTYNLTSLHNLAVWFGGALFASCLFFSAAVGPAGHFI